MLSANTTSFFPLPGSGVSRTTRALEMAVSPSSTTSVTWNNAAFGRFDCDRVKFKLGGIDDDLPHRLADHDRDVFLARELRRSQIRHQPDLIALRRYIDWQPVGFLLCHRQTPYKNVTTQTVHESRKSLARLLRT